MAPQTTRYSKPPRKNPKLYCRLCFTVSNLKPLEQSEVANEVFLLPVIFKQLHIQLIPEDFPCSICTVCQEKLEELNYSNDDGLLDDWKDEGLLEYRRICTAANDAIRKQKRTPVRAPKKAKQPTNSNKRITLPFVHLDDNSYKCTLCADVTFDRIEACVQHYHETHPEANSSNTSTQNSTTQQQEQRFVCTVCSESFNQIEKLFAHTETHKSSQPISTTENQNGSAPVPPTTTELANYLFKCTICQQGFNDIDELIAHRAELHEPHLKRKKPKKSQPKPVPSAKSKPRTIISSAEYRCTSCRVNFDGPKSYYFHLNVMHEGNICDICGEKFPSASALTKHQAWHRASGEPDYNSVPSPLITQQYSPFTAVDNNAAQGLNTVEEQNFDCEMFVTCSGCLLAFRNDLDLNEHYRDCPAQLMMPEEEPFVIEDDDTRIVEISDDE
ncbi:zinc finger protein 208-like [Sabethes cyaneus]|uniref:zinc finger protein 208-like n=1 Tax=Sabethes cyaneus TaxID=53552 RepID=UPI00237EBADC|nr:zinc finger protein 208-like [Sabethes cyaneus]